MAEVLSPLTGTVARVERTVGATVAAADPVVVVESMKMEYAIDAGASGTVAEVRVGVGDAVQVGDVLAVVAEGATHGTSRASGTPDGSAPAGSEAPPAEQARADLAEVVERHAVGLDAARPEAVERRHGRGQRTARENVDDLLDPGSFVEYGPLVIAAQRRRRELDDLIARTPADGLVAGVGTVDGRPTAVLSYDYTVLAGTQGFRNHHKKDRLFDVIERLRLPAVFFAEGGGGRPGDTDAPGVSGLDTLAFHLWGRLSGLVPRVGITSGRCFAGNAALLGSSDVVIATRGANIGMGGPAMIEGGGLGVYAPDDVGPVDVQVANGVVDVLVDDEAEAVAVARRYLSYFAGPAAPPAEGWTA
ncbi:MAG TPA: carboxyl transferase domain-containing protein, partial [Acidimicrobiales bacterium]|nr:carboxyl transferase domain-containing protein [Acidimicrobiales bacterium]